MVSKIATDSEHPLVTEARSLTRKHGVLSLAAQEAWLRATIMLENLGRREEARGWVVGLASISNKDKDLKSIFRKIEIGKLANLLEDYDSTKLILEDIDSMLNDIESMSSNDSTDLLVELVALCGYKMPSIQPYFNSTSIHSDSLETNQNPSSHLADQYVCPKLQAATTQWREDGDFRALVSAATELARLSNTDHERVMIVNKVGFELLNFPHQSSDRAIEEIDLLIDLWGTASEKFISRQVIRNLKNMNGGHSDALAFYRELPRRVSNSSFWLPLKIIVILQNSNIWPIEDIVNFVENEFIDTFNPYLDSFSHQSLKSSASRMSLAIHGNLEQFRESIESVSQTGTDSQAVESIVKCKLRQGHFRAAASVLDMLSDLDGSLRSDVAPSGMVNTYRSWLRILMLNHVGEHGTSPTLATPPVGRLRALDDLAFSETNAVVHYCAQVLYHIEPSAEVLLEMEHLVSLVQHRLSTNSFEYVVTNYSYSKLLSRSNPNSAVRRLRKQRSSLELEGFSSQEFLAHLALLEIDALYLLGRDRECTEVAMHALNNYFGASPESECKLVTAQLRSTANMLHKTQSVLELIERGSELLQEPRASFSDTLQHQLRIELMRNADNCSNYDLGISFVLPIFDSIDNSLDSSNIYMISMLARLASKAGHFELERRAWLMLGGLASPMSHFYTIRGLTS